MAYIGSSPTKVVSRQSANIFTYTAVANQTAFTGADANGNTLACTPSDIMVHMNGLRLEESDYTASTTTVTLGSGAAAGDEVTITAFVTFETADAYTKSASDTRYVNTSGDTMTGNLGIGIGSDSAQGTLDVRGAIVTSNSTTSYWKLDRDDSTGSFTINDTGANNRMLIDTSGRVTIPNQPVFSYLGSKSHVISTTGDQVMSSSNVWSASVNHALNRGSHFNASNGRFTAPVTGTYALYFRCQASNLTSGYLWFYFKVNGSAKSYAQKSQEAAHTAMTHHMIFELSASDYVTSEWTNNYVSGQIHYPSFSGHLIG